MNFTTADKPEPAKKFSGLILVILFHAALVYALLHGLGSKIALVIKEPLNVVLVDEIKETPPPATPKLPQPKLETPLPTIPPPEVSVPAQPVVDTISATVSETPQSSNNNASNAPTDSQANGPVRVPAIVDARACQKPAYPMAALRNEETGTVSLSFLVGTDGRVVDSKIEKSSGHRMLDSAARAALSLCKFIPGTLDGKPEQFWTRMDYVWKLEQ